MDAQRKYQLANVGEVHTTNEGYVIKIIDGGVKNSHCLIEFNYNGFRIEVLYKHVKEKCIKNPFHPSVYGKGYFGVGKHKAKIGHQPSRVYTKWHGMIARGYDSKVETKFPTYKKVTVAEEWHNYQVFAEWHEAQYDPDNNFDLDKDLLSKEIKIYSPETCCLIPQYLNKFIAKTRNNTSGVSKKGKRFQSRIASIKENRRIYLGTFNTINEASNAYKNARNQNIIDIKLKLVSDYPLIMDKILNAIS